MTSFRFENCSAEDLWKYVASYIHFKAKDCLDQAVMIAQRHPINMERVRVWCVAEGSPQSFDDF